MDTSNFDISSQLEQAENHLFRLFYSIFLFSQISVEKRIAITLKQNQSKSGKALSYQRSWTS